MQQDVAAGFYTISVLEGGEGALGPLSTATMEQARCCFCFSFIGYAPGITRSEGRRVLGFPQAYGCEDYAVVLGCFGVDVAALEPWLMEGVLRHHIWHVLRGGDRMGGKRVTIHRL